MKNWKDKLVKETVDVWKNTENLSLIDIQKYLSSYRFMSDCLDNALSNFEKWSYCLDDVTIDIND